MTEQPENAPRYSQPSHDHFPGDPSANVSTSLLGSIRMTYLCVPEMSSKVVGLSSKLQRDDFVHDSGGSRETRFCGRRNFPASDKCAPGCLVRDAPNSRMDVGDWVR